MAIFISYGKNNGISDFHKIRKEMVRNSFRMTGSAACFIILLVALRLAVNTSNLAVIAHPRSEGNIPCFFLTISNRVKRSSHLNCPLELKISGSGGDVY